MSTPLNIDPGQHIQRLQRGWTDEFTDQHGRRFSAQYELASSRPIGELTPVGFQPPWVPPMSAIRWERHGGFRFRWDYETVARQFADGSEQFYTEVMEFMMAHMPTEAIPEVDEPIPAKARRLFKPPMSAAIPLACEAGDPWMLGVAGAPVNTLLRDLLAQSVTANGREAVRLIRERTKERLSGTVTVPTIAPEAVPSTTPRTIHTTSTAPIATMDLSAVTYREFMAAALADGFSMVRGAEIWALHKANVAADASDSPVERVA